MNRKSEDLLKQAAGVLDVPIHDVPSVVKNLLNEVNELDALITQLK